MHPLDGALAKVTWAYDHAQALKTEFLLAPNYGDAVQFVQEFDADTSTIEVTLQGLPDALPVSWALRAADAFQNLRAALNYLAWELARFNLELKGETRDPDRNTQFPINTRPGEFSDWRLKDVHPSHVARIKELQPNEATHMTQFAEALKSGLNPESAAASHPLAVLADLTNVDKHKVLQLALIGTQVANVGPHEASDCTIASMELSAGDLKNDAIWLRFHVVPTGPDPKVQVEDTITTEVTVGGRGFERTFVWIARFVRSTIGEFWAIAPPEM